MFLSMPVLSTLDVPFMLRSVVNVNNCYSCEISMKKTSMPDVRTGIYSHMPIAITTSGGQFVTRASRLPGQFVAPG